MTTTEIEALCQAEASKHNLKISTGWFQETGIWACYMPVNRSILFNYAITNLDYATVMWIVRHELAHAMDYASLAPHEYHDTDEQMHGENWKKCCKIIGCPSSQFVM
jgi:predicted SprT family Zn-dependent metalloprotease